MDWDEAPKNPRHKRQRGIKGRPWYRAQVDAWYIKQGGKQIPIVDSEGQPVRGEENGSLAARYWLEMQMAAQATERGNANPVRLVFTRYLDEVQNERPALYPAYKRTLVGFAESMPKDAAVASLTAEHVRRWFDLHPNWSESTRGQNLGVVLAALNWGARPENRLVDFNPLKGMKKPRRKSRGREAVLPEGALEAFMEQVPADFREVLVVLKETATRPGNVGRVTAADLDLGRMVWVLEEHKTAGKTGRPLLVPMTPEVAEICKGLAARHPKGPLFRTAAGLPWTSKRIGQRFDYYARKLRDTGIDLPEKFFAYCLRHSLLTALLEAGESESVVAAVAGHKGTQTLHKHYSHILSKAAPVVAAVTRHATARGRTGGTPTPGADVAGNEGPAEPPSQAAG
jgi:integrase